MKVQKALVQRVPPFSLATEPLEYQPLLNLRALTCLPVSWN